MGINREERNIRFPEDDLSDKSNIEAVVEYDRISSEEDLDDVIDYSDSVTGNEEHNEDGMSGSYAYMSGGVPYMIHWLMRSDGSFEFSYPQMAANSYYSLLDDTKQD